MYLILLSVKQGGIKYHFWSLWYDVTKDWTQISRTIGEQCLKNILCDFLYDILILKFPPVPNLCQQIFRFFRRWLSYYQFYFSHKDFPINIFWSPVGDSKNVLKGWGIVGPYLKLYHRSTPIRVLIFFDRSTYSCECARIACTAIFAIVCSMSFKLKHSHERQLFWLLLII